MYQQGTASSTADLVRSAANFAAAAGWTIDESDAAYSYDWLVAMHRGGSYIWICAQGLTVQCYGATGYTRGVAPNAQPGASPAATCNFFSAPFSGTYFFSDPSQAYLHIVVQVTAGVFAHIHVGSLTSIGGAPLATYVQVTQWAMNNSAIWGYVDSPINSMPWSTYSYYSGCIGVALDGATVWYRSGAPSPVRLVLPLQANGLQQFGLMSSPSTFNALSPLFPIPVYCERASRNVFTPVGMAPDIRVVNMAYYDPGDEVTIGQDVWKIFPVVAKGPWGSNYNTPAPSSGNYGYAFRKLS